MFGLSVKNKLEKDRITGAESDADKDLYVLQVREIGPRPPGA